MTASKSLPARPSLESLRKQAKKLARDSAAGDAAAVARVRAHLPAIELPLTQRNAQLVIAREYGYAGWQDLIAEVSKRLGHGLAWAAAQAKRIIHDNDVERLKQLLAEYPALLSWRGNEGEGEGARDGDDDGDGDGGDNGSLLRIATESFGDSFDPVSEEHFTRAACAEVLIDAGAVVTPAVFKGILESRARGLLRLFQRKGLLPRRLKFLAALGDIDGVRAALDERTNHEERTTHNDRTDLDENVNDVAVVNEAFMYACSFQHEAVASVLLDRAIVLAPALGAHVDGSGSGSGSEGRLAFIRSLIAHRSEYFEHAPATPEGPWRVFVMAQVMIAVRDADVTAFVSTLRHESWLLGDAYVPFQMGNIIERATLLDRGEFITALLDLDPALLRRQPPPSRPMFDVAFTYARPHLVPLLTRIWPIPDDLPHAAGMGNLARVKQWFDESGAPALGDLHHHYPCNDAWVRGNLQWGTPRAQQVLDTAFAWAVVNRHFDVADFLLEHGADINTTWSSHEPASILHDLVFQANYESMQFLIDRGIDMTIKDYRWNATARGWAFYAAKDEKMAQWLDDAERQRAQKAR